MEVAHEGTAVRQDRPAIPGDAEARAWGAGQPGFPQFRTACRALKQADLLRAAGQPHNPAAFLYAAAARLMLEAVLIEREITPDPSSSLRDRWQQWRASGPTANAASELESEATERAVFLADPANEGLLAGLSPAEQLAACALLARFTRGLGTGLFQRARRTERRLLLRRSLFGVAALVALLALAGLGHALSPKNVARGAKVLVPQRMPEYDPAKLVDGDRTGIGFHSAGPPFEVVLDLGTPRRLERAVVYNRSDCCRDRAKPVDFEVENAGKFQKVAERTTEFDIWRIALTPVTTQRVRLVSRSGQPFHLAELELY